ncbi:MAG: hypothetical protein AABX33_06465 [Nanoarchaeota archaeon]
MQHETEFEPVETWVIESLIRGRIDVTNYPPDVTEFAEITTFKNSAIKVQDISLKN